MTIDFTPSWQTIETPCLLQPGDIHLWSVPLEISADNQEILFGLLAEDERRRARRYLFDDDRRRFIACRGRLRRILAGYLGKQPRQVAFQYTGLGKPALDDASNASPPLFFNVSHSGELALVAITHEGELGADVERQRSLRDMQGLATRFFSQQESSGLFRMAPEFQPTAFFRIWTRKEAILKATGKGLTYPLHRLTVSFGDDDPPALLSLGDDPDEAGAWTLQHLVPQSDYVAAIATRFHPTRMQYWLWGDDD